MIKEQSSIGHVVEIFCDNTLRFKCLITIPHNVRRSLRSLSLFETYLAHKPGLSVLKHNELQALVIVAVTAVAMPAGARELVAGDGGSVVEADKEDGGFNLFESSLVSWVRFNEEVTVLWGGKVR